MTSRRARAVRRAHVLTALLSLATQAAGGQAAPVPVVAAGEGRTFSAALNAAMRMAVESGAGAMVAGAVAADAGRVTTDSVRSVSRGVVSRYALLDSATISGVASVKILAMVSPIAERSVPGARGSRVDAPGALWTANAAIESARSVSEGALLAELFSARVAQPSAYAYEIEAGPPVRSGANLRMRLRIVRTPSPAYAAMRDRAISILSAIAGPAGSRTTHFPSRERENPRVRSCVSRCESGERVVLNARAALDAAESALPPDPAALTGTDRTPIPDLFPDLYTVGGFALAFTDSAARRQRLVHVRSTRGFVAIADYLRSVFDDAKFHLELGDLSFDVVETFRAPRSGVADHHFAATVPRTALPVELVRGFRPRTSGGPGAPTTLGSPYVVLTLPAAGRAVADTALVDVWLTSEQLSRLSNVAVSPVGTTAPQSLAPHAGIMMPAPQARPQEPSIPAAVAEAISKPPLSDGDGATWVGGLRSTAAAVGTGVVQYAGSTQACMVARLRAQRELVRLITGSRLESRTSLASSESRGTPVQESFREEITETIAGRLAGAALAAQWHVGSPARCRVALWLADGVSVMHDSTVSPED
jgi:hypothetical protein